MWVWSAASTPVAIRLWCRATTATGSGKRQFRAGGFSPTSCRRTDGYCIAGGIDAAFVVAEVTHQRGRNVEVARGGLGVDVDGSAADDPLHHFQPDLANGERLVEQLEFVPCRPAADVQISAKAQRMNRLTDDLLDGGDAAEIDDRDDLPGDIRKAVTIARENLGRSLDRSCKAACEEPLDGTPAFGSFEIALCCDGAVLADGQDVARILKMGLQSCQPFVPLRHQEMHLHHPFRIGGIKAAGAVFDGVTAIGGKCLADAQRNGWQRFRREALDGVAVNAGDLCGLDGE